jgi:hypothetical protein
MKGFTLKPVRIKKKIRNDQVGKIPNANALTLTFNVQEIIQCDVSWTKAAAMYFKDTCLVTLFANGCT